MNEKHCKHGKTEFIYCADCHVEELIAEVRHLREERNKLIKAQESYLSVISGHRSIVNNVKEETEYGHYHGH